MIDRIGIIVVVMLMSLMTAFGQSLDAMGDLQHALYWSQNGAGGAAFDGSRPYAGNGSLPDIDIDIPIPNISSANPSVQQVYNSMQTSQNKIESYIEKARSQSQYTMESALSVIKENGEVLPVSPEEAADMITNGNYGNYVYDPVQDMNSMPEYLLQGVETMNFESLKDKLRKMSEEEIEEFANDLNEKFENGEELTDEELDFLIAREKETFVELKEEFDRLVKLKIQKKIDESLFF